MLDWEIGNTKLVNWLECRKKKKKPFLLQVLFFDKHEHLPC